MTLRLDIEALRALVVIEQCGGVTRAADQLAVSQPAVSHKIKRLEQALGCDVLARRSGGPLFTDAGAQLLGYARRMVDIHDEALAAIGKTSLTGTINLGMTEDTTGGDISRILGRFTRSHPGVRVQTRISQSLTLSRWLADKSIDIAVMQVFLRDTCADDVVLFEDDLHWIKSPDLNVAPARPVPLLTFDSNCFYKHWAEEAGASAGHRFETVLECPSVHGILSSVRSGLGVAIMNGLHLPADCDIIRDVFPAPPRIAYVVRTSPGRRSGAVKALVQAISHELNGPTPLRVA